MLLEFIYMSSLPFVTTVTTEKLWGKKWHRTKFEKSIKNDNIKFREKKMTKRKSNFKSINI